MPVSDPTPALPRRERRRLATAAGLVLLAGLAACGKDATPSSSPSTSPATTVAATTGTTAAANPLMAHGDPESNTGVPGPGGSTCISKAPGEVYSASEAFIRFSPETICPGFVTVTVGTPVTFDNRDTAPHEVRITRGAAADAPVVASQTVAPGQQWAQSWSAADNLAFRIDAIPSFVGTITVTG
ncbi:MAG: hypothetical protein U0Q07_00920 [Acidimicrobiales bacterium]